MSGWYALDANHNLVPSNAGKYQHVVVKQETVGEWWVSTVFLGLNHRYDVGPPLVFETMVFHSDGHGGAQSWQDKDCERYATWAEAEVGHAAMVEKWRERRASDVVADE